MAFVRVAEARALAPGAALRVFVRGIEVGLFLGLFRGLFLDGFTIWAILR